MTLQEQLDFQLQTLSKQNEQQDVIQRRELKKEAFRLALSIKPSDYSSGLSPQKSNYGVSTLISDANKIYEELIK